jgi:hypothetical protein
VFKHGHAVEDDDQRKGNGQPAVPLPNPSAPVHWDLLSSNIGEIQKPMYQSATVENSGYAYRESGRLSVKGQNALWRFLAN